MPKTLPEKRGEVSEIQQRTKAGVKYKYFTLLLEADNVTQYSG